MNLPERGPGQMCIGVAIHVPEPFGEQLRHARAQCGDPLADAIPPHITVVGPTVIDRDCLGEVVDHLTEAVSTVAPFKVHLQDSETFRPVSSVVFVPLVLGLAECGQLEHRIRCGPLAQPLRFEYYPHVTVAHGLPDEVLDDALRRLRGFSAQFVVSGVHLYEQGADGVWRPQQFFALRAGAPVPDDAN